MLIKKNFPTEQFLFSYYKASWPFSLIHVIIGKSTIDRDCTSAFTESSF